MTREMVTEKHIQSEPLRIYIKHNESMVNINNSSNPKYNKNLKSLNIINNLNQNSRNVETTVAPKKIYINRIFQIIYVKNEDNGT